MTWIWLGGKDIACATELENLALLWVKIDQPINTHICYLASYFGEDVCQLTYFSEVEKFERRHLHIKSRHFQQEMHSVVFQTLLGLNW